MAPAIKRKHTSLAATTRPITAFFERKRPALSPHDSPLDSVDTDESSKCDSIDEIDEEDDELASGAADDVTVVATPSQPLRPPEPQQLNTAHIIRILHCRELGTSAVMMARSVPCSSARRRRQQTDQRLARWALTQFCVLPLQFALPEDALRVVRSHRLVSHCDEFYASCMAFDSQGALLAAGSSNGVIALFDCDEVFHRTINLQQVGSHWGWVISEGNRVDDGSVLKQTPLDDVKKAPTQVLHPVHQSVPAQKKPHIVLMLLTDG